nr:hypothetical protein [Tanacetum cinerariifolium]
MIAYLIKSDASQGFNQIINFFNGSLIKYALTVNPNIHVSCIKHFWTSFAVKKVNDIMRLQALVNKKKVIITEASIRDALRLDDAEGVECLPNEEIFTDISAKASLNKFSSSIASAVIYLSTGDLSSHSTKYTSPALTQKVFANMRRVGKGFFGVDTPLFEGMLVAQEVGEDVDEVHAEVVNTTGVIVEGAASDDVNAAIDEQSIPSPTPPTPPPQPSQHIPSTSQGIIENINANEDVVLENAKDVAVEKSADVLSMQVDEESKTTELQEVVDVVTTSKIITEVVTTASTTLTAATLQLTTAAAPTLIAAPSRRIKGVVIRDPQEIVTSFTIIHFKAKSKDKGKGNLVEEPKPLKKQA